MLTQSGDAARAAARNRGRPRLQEDAEGEAAAGAEGEGRDAAEGDDAAAADEDAAGEEVHVVTAAEAAAGTYSIDDVVLPLPGSQTRMPEHATAGVYASLAAADGISLDSSPHGAQEFSVTALAGAYRRVLHRPTDLEVCGGGAAAGDDCTDMQVSQEMGVGRRWMHGSASIDGDVANSLPRPA